MYLAMYIHGRHCGGVFVFVFGLDLDLLRAHDDDGVLAR